MLPATVNPIVRPAPARYEREHDASTHDQQHSPHPTSVTTLPPLRWNACPDGRAGGELDSRDPHSHHRLANLVAWGGRVLLFRPSPPHARESVEVAVIGHNLCGVFCGKGCDVPVRHEVATRPDLVQQTTKH